MELKIQKQEQHGFQLKPVPSEKLTKFPREYTKLVDEEKNEFRIVDYYKVSRNEIFPASMFLLALGKEVTSEIWNYYPNSKFIYLFIVEAL